MAGIYVLSINGNAPRTLGYADSLEAAVDLVFDSPSALPGRSAWARTDCGERTDCATLANGRCVATLERA